MHVIKPIRTVLFSYVLVAKLFQRGKARVRDSNPPRELLLTFEAQLELYVIARVTQAFQPETQFSNALTAEAKCYLRITWGKMQIKLDVTLPAVQFYRV